MQGRRRSSGRWEPRRRKMSDDRALFLRVRTPDPTSGGADRASRDRKCPFVRTRAPHTHLGPMGSAAYGPRSPIPPTGIRPRFMPIEGPLYRTTHGRWLSGSGGERPGTEATSRTPSAPSARPTLHLHVSFTRYYLPTAYRLSVSVRDSPRAGFVSRHGGRREPP